MLTNTLQRSVVAYIHKENLNYYDKSLKESARKTTGTRAKS